MMVSSLCIVCVFIFFSFVTPYDILSKANMECWGVGTEQVGLSWGVCGALRGRETVPHLCSGCTCHRLQIGVALLWSLLLTWGSPLLLFRERLWFSALSAPTTVMLEPVCVVCVCRGSEPCTSSSYSSVFQGPAPGALAF